MLCEQMSTVGCVIGSCRPFSEATCWLVARVDAISAVEHLGPGLSVAPEASTLYCSCVKDGKSNTSRIADVAETPAGSEDLEAGGSKEEVVMMVFLYGWRTV